MIMSDKVIIKTIHPDHKNAGESTFNAGAASMTFIGDQTAPVDRDKAEAFMTHFGAMRVKGQPAFTLIEIKDKPKADKPENAPAHKT